MRCTHISMLNRVHVDHGQHPCMLQRGSYLACFRQVLWTPGVIKIHNQAPLPEVILLLSQWLHDYRQEHANAAACCVSEKPRYTHTTYWLVSVILAVFGVTH